MKPTNWIMTITGRLILICALLFAITACSGDVKTEILGQWQGLTLQQDFTFYTDGRVEMRDRKHGTYQGVYHISDDKVLTCEFEGFGRPVVRTVEISGDTLTLINPKSVDEEYRRY